MIVIVLYLAIICECETPEPKTTRDTELQNLKMAVPAFTKAKTGS